MGGQNPPFIVPLFAMVFLYHLVASNQGRIFCFWQKISTLTAVAQMNFLTMQTTPQSAQITSDKVRQKAVLCTTKKRAFLGGFKRGYPHFGQCNIWKIATLVSGFFEILLTGHFLTSRYFILGIGLSGISKHTHRPPATLTGLRVPCGLQGANPLTPFTH